MGFKCGIVGLPNVGKSTLFNALTKTAMAQAENYPFCTIEPNVGEVAIPDPRLYKLAEIAKSENQGGWHAFLYKFYSDGNEIFSFQFGEDETRFANFSFTL